MAKGKPKFRVGDRVIAKGRIGPDVEDVVEQVVARAPMPYKLASGRFRREDELRPLTARERGSHAK